MALSHDLKFECIRCGNCCTDKTTIVNTSYFDILRIKDGLNLTLDELIYILGFYIFDRRISERTRKKLVISPVIVEKGYAFVGLFKKKNGDCYFYNREKRECTIYNLRPMFCKTFPFSYQKIDKYNKESSYKVKIFTSNKGIEYCQGIRNDSPPINIEEWLKLGKKALEEIEKNEKVVLKYNLLVQEKKFQPTVKNFLTFLMDLDLKFEIL